LERTKLARLTCLAVTMNSSKVHSSNFYRLVKLASKIRAPVSAAVLTLNKNNRDATAVQVESLLSRLLEGEHPGPSTSQQAAPIPSLQAGAEGPAVSHHSAISGLGLPSTSAAAGDQHLIHWPEDEEGEGETSTGTFSFVEGVMVDEPPENPDWFDE
jgi:hypothetical protein